MPRVIATYIGLLFYFLKKKLHLWEQFTEPSKLLSTKTKLPSLQSSWILCQSGRWKYRSSSCSNQNDLIVISSGRSLLPQKRWSLPNLNQHAVEGDVSATRRLDQKIAVHWREAGFTSLSVRTQGNGEREPWQYRFFFFWYTVDPL